jgi:hypothetical protein
MATEARETGSLIGSDKVEGTAVYGANDTKIGSIERVMIDKKSGRVSYAVLSFGGFLGIGDDHYPLPWQSLKYDTNLGGYRTGITETQLKGAPGRSSSNYCRCRISASRFRDPAAAVDTQLKARLTAGLSIRKMPSAFSDPSRFRSTACRKVRAGMKSAAGSLRSQAAMVFKKAIKTSPTCFLRSP